MDPTEEPEEEQRTFAELSDDEKQQVREHFREAAYHYAAHWDALGCIEALLGREVNVEDIGGFAAAFGCPAESDHTTSFSDEDICIAIGEEQAAEAILV
jgi:hypothetical protein